MLERFNIAFNLSITPNALQLRIVRTKTKDKATINNNVYRRVRPEKGMNGTKLRLTLYSLIF